MGQFVDKMVAVVGVHVVVPVFTGIIFHASSNTVRTQSTETRWLGLGIQVANVAKVRIEKIDLCCVFPNSVSKFQVHSSVVNPTVGGV